MRERLIALIDRADEECKHTKDCKHCSGYGKGSRCMNYHIADHLIANGVVVLPVKVGQTIYFLGGINGKLIQSATVEEIIVTDSGARELLVITENGIAFDDSLESFFLTREEAERALKEGGKG